ncbi:MAG: sugar kinase [Rhodospirillales bacterium]|nr:sugar kinase [Rhodospirillales bacterium]
MKKIAVIGEILVEIMADSQGEGFLGPIALTGPYPSGAPAIYIDQVAKLGQPGAIISVVGNDDFGRVNLNRLEQDGVDISAVSVDPDRPTGTAFVRYRPDGSRDFVFNIKHSACGRISVSDATTRLIETVDHVHVMGSSLSSAEFVALNLRAARSVKGRGGTVSFDPNLRKEILDSPGMREAMAEILALTDLFLPSGEEILLLTQATETDGAVQELLGLGIRALVHKLGSDGVRFFDDNGSRFVRAFQVEEIDPTGAGDCFGGAFTALWLRGGDIDETLRLAAAAGALAVTRRGPMEGTSDLETLKRFVETSPAHEAVSGLKNHGFK